MLWKEYLGPVTYHLGSSGAQVVGNGQLCYFNSYLAMCHVMSFDGTTSYGSWSLQIGS